MKTIAAVVRDGVRMFDLAVINEIWGIDRTADGVPAFTLLTCALDGQEVTTDMGAICQPTHSLESMMDADLVVIPGLSDPESLPDSKLLDAIRYAAEAGTTVAALCGGAFLLGQSGLLDGRRATTHWIHAADLQNRFPLAHIDQDSLFVEDGNVWTSAGTVAGIDLCLHLVQMAHGASVAAAIARRMITQPHRSGGQRQFIETPIPLRVSDEDRLGSVISWAAANLAEPLTVGMLAKRAQVSDRTFARRFVESTGTTPLKWLHHQRVQQAQRLLELSECSVEEIASRCGFGGPAVLRRHFVRITGTSPTEYRRGYMRGNRGSTAVLRG